VAYCMDAISISIGSLLGTSPVTAFIESAVRSLHVSQGAVN
jgi:AGZA family xanthine/uracil permease-like MFS transporter